MSEWGKCKHGKLSVIMSLDCYEFLNGQIQRREVVSGFVSVLLQVDGGNASVGGCQWFGLWIFGRHVSYFVGYVIAWWLLAG